MIKVFISVPMKNRTTENIKASIRKMEEVAKIFLDVNNDEIEFISTYIEETPPEGADSSIWYLGGSIQLLAHADYLVCPEDTSYAPGCAIEKSVFSKYKGIDKIIEIENRFLYPYGESWKNGMYFPDSI